MASPGNTLIPSISPISLIIRKCHLISQVHVAKLISEKGTEMVRWKEVACVLEPVEGVVSLSI